MFTVVRVPHFAHGCNSLYCLTTFEECLCCCEDQAVTTACHTELDCAIRMQMTPVACRCSTDNDWCKVPSEPSSPMHSMHSKHINLVAPVPPSLSAAAMHAMAEAFMPEGHSSGMQNRQLHCNVAHQNVSYSTEFDGYSGTLPALSPSDSCHTNGPPQSPGGRAHVFPPPGMVKSVRVARHASWSAPLPPMSTMQRTTQVSMLNPMSPSARSPVFSSAGNSAELKKPWDRARTRGKGEDSVVTLHAQWWTQDVNSVTLFLPLQHFSQANLMVQIQESMVVVLAMNPGSCSYKFHMTPEHPVRVQGSQATPQPGSGIHIVLQKRMAGVVWNHICKEEH